MNLKFKRTMGMALAAATLTMSASPAVTFADEIKGEVSAPVISVQMPTFANGSFTMDPYNQLLTGQKIISSEFVFKNNSTVDMKLTLSGYECQLTGDFASSTSLQTSYEDLSEDTSNKILLGLVAMDKDEHLVDEEWSSLEDGEHAVIFKSGNQESVDQELGTMARGAYATRNEKNGSIIAVDRKLTDGSDKLLLKFDGDISGTPDRPWEKVAISVVPEFTCTPVENEDGKTSLDGVAAQSATPTFPTGTISAATKFTGTVEGLPQGVTVKTTLLPEDYTLTVTGATKAATPKLTVVNKADGTATIDLTAICSDVKTYGEVKEVKIELEESAFKVAEGYYKTFEDYSKVSFTWTKQQ